MAVARWILRALVHRVHPPGQPRRMEDGGGEGKERCPRRRQGCELTTLKGRRPGLEVPGWRVGGAWRSQHPHDIEGQVRQRTASYHFAKYPGIFLQNRPLCSPTQNKNAVFFNALSVSKAKKGQEYKGLQTFPPLSSPPCRPLVLGPAKKFFTPCLPPPPVPFALQRPPKGAEEEEIGPGGRGKEA